MEKKSLPTKRYTVAEASVIERVRSRFNSSKMSRRNNCYWGAPDTDGDWESRWDLQEKVVLGWSEPPSQDEYESNVKSPMASGRIDATMNKLRRLDLQFIVRPDDVKDPKDKRKARVVQELLNNLFQRRAYKTRLMSWFEDCLIHGSAFLHVYYLKKSRKVKQPNIDTKKMSDEEKEKIKSGEKVYKEEEIYDYDDIAVEPVKMQEIYADPSARTLHGTSYEAQWVIRRMLPSYDQFKAMYKNDPDAKNVSKVRPVSYYVKEEVEFFEPPKDIDDDNYVELLHYYDKARDEYIVLANDVVIKEMPLPYRHKQLPFVKINAYDVVHQFYGMGVPDKVLNVQSEEEILKNLVYDRLHITANPMMKVKKSVYGEFSKAYQTGEPGLMLPVNAQDDVMPLEYPTMNFDMFRAIELLERDAVMATQIDPIQMGVNQKYVSATTSMLTKEQMDSYITALIDTWTEPLSILAKQIVSLMSQFYTVPRVEAAGKTARNRQVRLIDIEINPDTLDVKESRGKYTYLEIKPDFFDINGDWDIEIAPESVEVQSRAIEMQKSQANLAQLAPFFVDPSNPQSVMMNPNGYIDGPKTIEWYLETNSLPKDLMATTTEDEDISVERATLQGKKMIAGESVPGIPGEPEAHKKVHVKQMIIVNEKKAEIDKQFEQVPQEMLPMMMNTDMGRQLMQLDKISNIFAEHLMEDDKPKVLEVQGSVQSGMPQQPQVPMPPGLTPAGSAQPPAPAGGNQQSGMGPELPQQGRPTSFEQGM